MARFTVRVYSESGFVPQDETRIIFESDDLRKTKVKIMNYFKKEDYFNVVYFIDNKLGKSGYVGRDLTIEDGEDLNSFCEEEVFEEVINNKNFDALTTMYGIALNGVLSQEENRLEECDTILTKSLKALEIIKYKAVNLYYVVIVNNYINYNRCIDEFFGNYEYRDIFYLTEQEYNLLKGALYE